MRIHQVVELRVHGVSGTPPEDLLDRSAVQLLDGDKRAGFYRSRNPADIDDIYLSRPGDTVGRLDGPYLEGYAWGGMTSGSAFRALWLLLLPFSLLNVAPRLRPADPARTGGAHRARMYTLWLVCRLLALASTVVFVMAFVGVGVDLIGWQCIRGPACSTGASWLDRLMLKHTAEHRLLAGAALPLLVLALLWYIGGRTINRYESTKVIDALRVDAEAKSYEPPGLDSTWMWRNEAPVRRLRAAHLQAAIGVVVAFVGGASGGWEAKLGVLVGCVVIALAVFAIAVPDFTSPTPATVWTVLSVTCWLALLGAGVALVVRLGWVTRRLTDSPRYDPTTSSPIAPGGLPGFATTALWLLLAEFALMIVLAAVVIMARIASAPQQGFGVDGPRPGILGMGTWVFSVMAVFMGAVFTAGVYLYAAGFLRSDHHWLPKPSEITPERMSFTIPEVILDAGFAYAIAVMLAGGVLVLAGLGAAVVLGLIKDRSPLIVKNSGATDYDGDWVAGSKRKKEILRAMWLGRVVDIAGWPLAFLMTAGVVLSFGMGGALLVEHVFGRTGATIWLARQHGLQAAGAYAVVLTLVLLVVLGYYAFRKASLRRSVGILWDLASFWPRLSHPLAAPCYAERAVPDLVQRLELHTGTGYGVVLAAHSQGTVLSAAAVMQLRTRDALADDDVLPKVALLTFGCVLRRLYARFFPAYFGAATLAAVNDALLPAPNAPVRTTRWRNLWRYTDYLGGPVTVGPPPVVQQPWPAMPPSDPASEPLGGLHIDAHLVDPPFDARPGRTDVPAPRRHSDFWKDPEFQRAVSFLAGTIP